MNPCRALVEPNVQFHDAISVSEVAEWIPGHPRVATRGLGVESTTRLLQLNRA